jgi:general secretion pathway protein G
LRREEPTYDLSVELQSFDPAVVYREVHMSYSSGCRCVTCSMTSRRSGRARARGFTLIEIMVVVVVTGLLAAVFVPAVVGPVERARVTKAKQDIRSLETALAMFKRDNAKYPTTDQGLTALVQQPTDPSIRNWRPGGYLQHVSKDPWGYDYHYEFPGTHGKEYDLYTTLGADNQPGGECPNADIGNWNVSD